MCASRLLSIDPFSEWGNLSILLLLQKSFHLSPKHSNPEISEMVDPISTPPPRSFTGPMEEVSDQEKGQRLGARNSLVSSFSKLEELVSKEIERLQATFKIEQQTLPEYPSERSFPPSTLHSSDFGSDPTSKKEKIIQKLFREKSFGFVLLGIMQEAMPKKDEVKELEETVKAVDAQKIIQNLQLTNYNLQKELWDIESKQAIVEDRLLVAFEDMTKTVMEGESLLSIDRKTC